MQFSIARDLDQIQLARLNAHDRKLYLAYSLIFSYPIIIATLSRIDRDQIREDLISKGFHVPNYPSSDDSNNTVIDIGSQFDTFSVRSDNIQYGQSISSKTRQPSATTDGNWAQSQTTESSQYFFDGASTVGDTTDVETITDVVGVNDTHEGMNFDLLLSRDPNYCYPPVNNEVQQCKY